jgi:hypothetical protein
MLQIANKYKTSAESGWLLDAVVQFRRVSIQYARPITEPW